MESYYYVSNKEYKYNNKRRSFIKKNKVELWQQI